MWGIPYDDLDGWRGPYPPEVLAAQFEKMAEGLRLGIQRRLESEVALARQLFTLVREDSRIGFEPSCRYSYLCNLTWSH